MTMRRTASRGWRTASARAGRWSRAWTSFGAALALSAVIVPVAGYDLRVYAPTAAFGAAVPREQHRAVRDAEG